MRMLAVEEMAERVTPYLQEAGVLADPSPTTSAALLARAMPLVHERMNKLAEAAHMLGFLFVDEASSRRVRRREGARRRGAEGRRGGPRRARRALDDWTTAAIDEALRAALVDGLGIKPRNAFGPVRVAITGRRVSPPLFESLELLGRERSLARLDAAPAAAGRA